MAQMLSAGDIGRLNTPTTVAATDTTVVNQNGVLREATVQQVAAGGLAALIKADVTIPSASVLSLFGTPFTLVAAPGAGFAHVVESVFITKAAGTAYAGIAVGEDLAVKYTNASGAVCATCEMTGFADSTGLTSTYAPGVAVLPVENAALVAHMLTGDITTGNSDFKVTIYYRTRPVPTF